MKNLFLLFCFFAVFTTGCKDEDTQSEQWDDSPRTDVPNELTNAIWQVGSISFGNFWGDQGEYVGAGHDGAIRYYFKEDGTYELYSYISVRSYNCLTQSYTYVKGTVEVKGDKITFHPIEGKYKGADNCVSSYNFERPVKEDEKENFAKTYQWEVSEGNDGEDHLYMLEDGLAAEPENILVYDNEM
ncbi:hypothetical protein WJR50_30865 [Catalinimonas sp. 4WD22]|uniref:hypothetical protein n=1 Tax=Catalinimonas locisalis TaxID=3133978 RepID=UPI003101B0EB